MRSRFRPDHQLTTRMVVTMFLLGLVYVAFVAALIILIKSVVVVVATGIYTIFGGMRAIMATAAIGTRAAAVIERKLIGLLRKLFRQ